MKSVLLIDDDATLVLAVGVQLKAMGYPVYTAKDAVNAISAVRKNSPDVVVPDISLPAGVPRSPLPIGHRRKRRSWARQSKR